MAVTMLREKFESGRSLWSLVQRTLGEVYAQWWPRCSVLASSPGVPAAVRDAAAARLRDLRSHMVYLRKVQVRLAIWQSELLAAQDSARPDNGLTLDLVRQIHARHFSHDAFSGHDGVEIADRMDQFMQRNQHYLDAPAPGPAAPVIPSYITAYNDCTGYDATWDIQAQFFKYGTPVGCNLNRRRLLFADKSCVEIQAHVPAGAYSSGSDLAVAGACLAGGAAVAMVVAGIMSFALIPLVAAGVAVGASVGATGTALVHLASRPYNAVWQGYTARYYRSTAAPSPSGIREFYGWKKADTILETVRINGSDDVSTFENFANTPENYEWWRWRQGNASYRSAEYDRSGLAVPRAGVMSLRSSMDQLVQSLAAFAPAPSGAGWSDAVDARGLADASRMLVGGSQSV